MNTSTTYATLITPPGEGGIGIIRMEGPDALSVLSQCFRPAGQTEMPIGIGELAYGHIIQEGKTLDEVILARTNHAQFEVNCHGGVAAVNSVLGRLTASPDVKETKWQNILDQQYQDRRALSEDSIQAAALAHLPKVETRPGATMLLHQLNGALYRELKDILKGLTTHRESQRMLRSLMDRYTIGHALVSPPRVLIAGPPNVGKSTLLNAFLHRERVIVHDTPGTTRDIVRETVSIEGVPFEIIDSAGIRDQVDEVESEAISRSLAFVEECDILLWLEEANPGHHSPFHNMPEVSETTRVIQVLNKVDLLSDTEERDLIEHISSNAIFASAQNGMGIDNLEDEIVAPYQRFLQAVHNGAAVPFTDAMMERLSEISALIQRDELQAAEQLRKCMTLDAKM